MKVRRLVVVAALAALATTAVAQQNPFSAFKGKMKEGMYEYKMEMDMGQIPGMPPGMGKQSMTMQHCITAEDIEKGGLNKGRDGQMPKNCEIKNFKMSGNTASYTMACTGEHKMNADNVITFQPNGYDMDMKMQMDRGGQAMTMNQKAQARLVGPCK